MKKIIRKTTGTVLGLTLALVSGAPILADDTELLLVAPPNPAELKPNVLFILDTSGSMTSIQKTSAPYDSTEIYSAFGDCDANNLYYSDGSGEPVCEGATRYIAKSSWNCAASLIQIADVGTYTDVLVQYRESTDDGIGDGKAWRELEPGNSLDDVECEKDSGVHGSSDLNSAIDIYAAAGTDSVPWTSNPDAEIAWGSSGRNVTYKIWDGNYLNYRKDPTTIEISRSDIMKEAIKTILNSLSDMNVGIMRFNDKEGGAIIRAPVDLDSNRAAILKDVDNLDADGDTPLSETLFETALYWQGLPAHYGELISENTTDPLAFQSTNPNIYDRPDMLSCSKNFNVLISDGKPNNDEETPTLLDRLPEFSTTLGGRPGCTGTGEGACLVDVAEYLSIKDISPVLDGRQSVVTHTIGYAIDLPILADTARLSGGQYVVADDTDSLLAALANIVAQINERSLSFTAPAVSVNTFNRTRNLNNVYLTMFAARGAAHWPGNLKAYRIEGDTIVDATGADAVDPNTGFFYPTARSFWTSGQSDGNDVLLGGAANQLPDPGVRRLFTNNGFDKTLSGATNAISTGNIDKYTEADFGITGDTPELADIIDWMRGKDVKDEDGDPATAVRYAMGDPLHSRPATIVYGGTEQNPESVIYTATNDGYLHAVDAETGKELWSYVPKELLPRMARLYFNPEMKYKLYGIDGDVVPVIRDSNNDGVIETDDDDFAFILFGMRRGGMTYRMLDVSDKNNPVLVWERRLNEAGQSWSSPVVTRMDISDAGQNDMKAVVVLGGGYDGVHDTATFNPAIDRLGAGIHVIDLMDGTTLWRAGHTSTEADLKLAKMTRSIPTRIKVVDINGDGFADRMYTADLGGQLWRFDISNGNPAASIVAGGVIARFGAEGLDAPTAADTRRFYNAPDVAIFNDVRQNRRFISVSIGSGYRAHPLDLRAADRFYSLRDPNVFNSLTQAEYDALVPFTESDLIDVSGQVDVTVTAEDAGWMLTLPPNEMVLADSVTFNDEVFFVSFSPDKDAADACTPGQGTNRLWRMSIINGDPIVDNIGDIQTGEEDNARRTELAQGGIAPTPQFLFPSPDDPDCTGQDCAPPPIGCVGVECFDPGFQNNPVRTLWTQDGIE